MFTEADNQGRTFVTGVIEGAPAHAAGILTGDEIVSSDTSVPPGRLLPRQGRSPVSLEIRRASGAAPISISVSPADLPRTRCSCAALKERAGHRYGQGQNWIRACLVLCEPPDSVRARGPDVRRTAQGRRRAGLGPARRVGRRATAIFDLFNPRAPTMQITGRNGETGFVGVKWRKPVAALINEGTRSGKEVLAYGFKEYRLGELVGHRTEGAVLAATAFLIGEDGLLLWRSRTCWSTVSASKGSASRRRSKSHSTRATRRAATHSSTRRPGARAGLGPFPFPPGQGLG